MIRRQFHNERSRIAGEHLGFLQDDTGNNDCCHTQEVCTGCNPSGAAEDCTCDHCDERLLCAAGDKGGCHNCHTAVTFIFNGSGSHDSGDAAAGTNQNRDKGLTRQTKLPEDTIQNECDTSHIAACFQDSQQDEQYQHLRYKAQNCAYTGNNTIQDQTLQPVGAVYSIQTLFDQNRNTRNPYAVISRIRFTLCELISSSVQVIHGCSFSCNFQRFFIFYIIGEVIIVILFESQDCFLCSFTVIGVCFCVDVFFQSGSICTLFVQVCNIAVNDSIGVTVFISSVIVCAGTNAQQVPAIAEHAVICPVCCSRTNGNHGDVIYQEHDYCEDRQTQPTVGNDLIDLIGCGQTALVLFLETILNNGSNVLVTLIGDNAFCIIVQFFFRSGNVLFNMCLVGIRHFQLFQNLFIPFEDLDCIPSLLFLRNVMQEFFFNVCNGMFYRAAKGVLRNSRFHFLCCSNGFIGSFLNTGALQCGNFNNLASQFLGKLVNADLVAALADNVHHVDGNNDRNAQFNELCGQIEVTLQVCTINDVQDCIRAFLNQIVSGNDFFQCVRGQGVNTRKVCDDNILVSLELTFFFLDSYAGPVTDELIGSCQRIEQGCLSGIWVAGKRNFQIHT